MKCPACEIEMVTVEIKGIEIDRCPGCEGIVLDKGEEEQLETLGLSAIVDGASPSDHATARARGAARCYTCERPMIAITGAGDVEYDWCDSCERVFFDRGELAEIAAFVDT